LADVIDGRGLVTPPGDTAAFADAIVALAEDFTKRQALGFAGRRYAATYLDRHTVLGQFEWELLDLNQHR
jgi:colanic acid biosynthesis glycosyl transferase WcaI